MAAITAGTEKLRTKPKAKPQIPAADLDRMVAESLKDYGSDEDISGDDDDPDLLDEFAELTGGSNLQATPSAAEDEAAIIVPTSSVSMPALLKSRLEMYRVAESNAKSANDTSKARRIGRGLKTLEGLLKQANAGKSINMDDVPPEVTVKPTQQPQAQISIAADKLDELIPTIEPPRRPAPAPPAEVLPAVSPPVVTPTAEIVEKKAVDEAKIAVLVERQREYKLAALSAKRAGHTDTALGFVKVVKMFDVVIQQAHNGENVDLSDMPPSPEELLATTNADPVAVPDPPKVEAETQHASDAPAVAESLVEATTVLEALTQRLEKYKSVEQAAKDEDNSSKARRFGRIVKQYEDAVKRCKAGKPVPFDELPTPPGFGPIPGVQVILNSTII